MSAPRQIKGQSSPYDPWSGTYEKPSVRSDSDGNIYFTYKDGTGRPWIEIYYKDDADAPDPKTGVAYLTSDNFTNPGGGGVPGWDPLVGAHSGDGYVNESGWRPAREGEEPVGRVSTPVEESPPLEESTPLFGPQEETPEPEYDPWEQPLPGHWDPVALRWVPDVPESRLGDSAARGFDPSVPFDPDTMPTSRLDPNAPEPGYRLNAERLGPDLAPEREENPDANAQDPNVPNSEEGAGGGGIIEPNLRDAPIPWGMGSGLPSQKAATPFDPDKTSMSVEGSADPAVPDPALPFDQVDPNRPGSGLFDEADSDAPTLNASLTDPTAPGPTLDQGLVEWIEQNPQLVNALNQNENLAYALEQDPTLIEQVEQGLDPAGPSFMEPGSGVTEWDSGTNTNLIDPSLTDPGIAGQDTLDQDFDGF